MYVARTVGVGVELVGRSNGLLGRQWASVVRACEKQWASCLVGGNGLLRVDVVVEVFLFLEAVGFLVLRCCRGRCCC